MNRFFYILLAFFALVSCSKDRTQTTIAENEIVNEILVEATVAPNTEIRVALINGVESWQEHIKVTINNSSYYWLPTRIKNFNYEKGYTYTLLLKETQYKNLLPIGSFFEYELAREVSKIQVSQKFR